MELRWSGCLISLSLIQVGLMKEIMQGSKVTNRKTQSDCVQKAFSIQGEKLETIGLIRPICRVVIGLRSSIHRQSFTIS